MKRKEVKQKALPTGWRKVRLGEVVSIRKEKFNPAINHEKVACIELEHIE